LRAGSGATACEAVVVEVTLADGYRLFVEEVGDGFPLIVLHGGPGLDHTMFRPWLDPLGDEFRVLYVDERGQGRSERTDPETLALEVFARDVDLLAGALELDRFALLGHSFGAIIATWHATELGTAAAYVISGGGDASDAMLADIETSFDELGERRRVIEDSWEREKTVATEEECAQLLEDQMPFHFHGPVPPGFGADTVYSPHVLRHFANIGYGDFDYGPKLAAVAAPTLVIVGEHDRTTTPRAARVLHEGIPSSELLVVPGTGHMSYVEAPGPYLDAARGFLQRSISP
jgi:proline iminopeptidase